jgi:hypothetical protein
MNGRDRLSIEEYARLKRRDREAVPPGQLTAEERASIAASEVPGEFADFDNELVLDATAKARTVSRTE